MYTLCMYVCMYIYIYRERERERETDIYIYIYISLSLSLSVYIIFSLSLSLHIYIYISLSLYIYIYIYILRLCRTGRRPARSARAILYYTILYYTILSYTILCYTVLYDTIPYRTILYYTIPYYTTPGAAESRAYALTTAVLKRSYSRTCRTRPGVDFVELSRGCLQYSMFIISCCTWPYLSCHNSRNVCPVVVPSRAVSL